MNDDPHFNLLLQKRGASGPSRGGRKFVSQTKCALQKFFPMLSTLAWVACPHAPIAIQRLEDVVFCHI